MEGVKEGVLRRVIVPVTYLSVNIYRDPTGAWGGSNAVSVAVMLC